MTDRTEKKKQWLAGFAWTGAAFASLLFFCQGENWQIGAIAVIGANLCLGRVDGRQRLDPAAHLRRGRARPRLLAGLGVGLPRRRAAAGGQPGLVTILPLRPERGRGRPAQHAVGGGLVGGVHDHPVPRGCATTRRPTSCPPRATSWRAASASSRPTLRDLRNYPIAVTFLVAYLFFNDGIQTVIASSSTYGSEQLGLGQTVLIGTILLVQFVAFFGALLFGRLAAASRRQAGHPDRAGDLDGRSSPRRCSCPPAGGARSCCSASPSASCSAAPRPWPAPTSRC